MLHLWLLYNSILRFNIHIVLFSLIKPRCFDRQTTKRETFVCGLVFLPNCLKLYL